MEQGPQKFLQAEETAERLVQTLNELHSEATSYQTATKELDNVRQRLVELIESTRDVVAGSHQVVNVLKVIGGPEILDRVAKLETTASREFTKQSKLSGNLMLLVALTLVSSIAAVAIGVVALIQ